MMPRVPAKLVHAGYDWYEQVNKHVATQQLVQTQIVSTVSTSTNHCVGSLLKLASSGLSSGDASSYMRDSKGH